jgi:regulator of CtrA degradation
MQFDTLERGRMPERDPGTANGVADQLARLKAAFGRA